MKDWSLDHCPNSKEHIEKIFYETQDFPDKSWVMAYDFLNKGPKEK
jgi:hypothetical protein